MTLLQVAYLIYQVIAGQLTVQAALAKVLSYAEHAAQETAPLALQTIAANGTNVVINPTYGNSALRDILLDRFADVDAAIAAITPTPPAPPPSAEENADAVWGKTDPNSSPTNVYGNELWASYRLANVTSHKAKLAIAEAPFFLVWSLWDDQRAEIEVAHRPDPDWGDILADDTRLSWLARTVPGWTWDWTPDGGTVEGSRDAATFLVMWELDLTEAEFTVLKAGVTGVLAPVWPGLDRVTLGDPVALAPDVTIPGPLDGVLVAITTPPTGLGKFEVGGETWWYRAGQLAFVSDRGDVEPWQYITWTHALYSPRQMFRADHAVVRGLAGIGGTVTPWLTT